MVADDAPRVNPCAASELVVHDVIGERRPHRGMHEAKPCGEIEIIACSLRVVGSECTVEYGNDISELFAGP